MARVGVTLAGHGYGYSRVRVRVRNMVPASFKTSQRSCKTDKNWLRYGQKRVVSLSSPFLIRFGCFWSHFEGKTRHPAGKYPYGYGYGSFPRYPREYPRHCLGILHRIAKVVEEGSQRRTQVSSIAVSTFVHSSSSTRRRGTPRVFRH